MSEPRVWRAAWVVGWPAVRSGFIGSRKAVLRMDAQNGLSTVTLRLFPDSHPVTNFPLRRWISQKILSSVGNPLL